MNEHLDVLIVGAGLSGIGAAYRIGHDRPDRRWAIFEARDAIGGTWDLFRYPGIRSDSDMTTLGFPFYPYRGEKAIADGADILAYLRDTARTFGIDRHIRYGHRVVAADWSSADARWTITYEVDGQRARMTCRLVFFCSGYYDYTRGHAPEWPGMADFGGTIAHPQAWPVDFPITGKRVVVIGSGATAVTLVPALVAQGAAHVTMLQRSPSYIVAMPAQDRLGAALSRLLPTRIADTLTRWKSIAYSVGSYTLARRRPDLVKRQIAKQQRAALGDSYDVAKHLTPRYNPWDQRLCLVPDGDLFAVLRDGRATIVTDTIDRFIPAGIALTSGDILPADLIVTATGLRLKLLGGATLSLDGRTIEPHRHLVYKGAMFSDVPNMAFSTGYTNASWTLRSDLSARFVARLLAHMDATGATVATPVPQAVEEATTPLLDLNSGYIQRVAQWLPRQGRRVPWLVQQNYVRDTLTMRGRVDDGVLRFR
ncbi:MAG: NAD(P)/FAD-dependent oxidoreductase [Sphingomonas phyllosphaerae]|uniref:flavin-containing monooxygenase n=1 Tax=Sphingomonas phyllosphaerae TaxID=257003 RepID=UPI002FFB8F40